MEGLADIDYDGDLTYEIQEFRRYFPNDQKHLVVEYSLGVGKVLVDMFEKQKLGRQIMSDKKSPHYGDFVICPFSFLGYFMPESS